MKQIQAFVAVADTGSLTAAADRLGFTQPALSYQLAELERTVGFKVFERRPRGVELTLLGSTLLDHARLIEKHLDAFQSAVSDAKSIRCRQPLRIVMSEPWSHCMTPGIVRHSNGLVTDRQLSIISLPAQRAVEVFEAGEADVLVSHTFPPASSTTALVTEVLVLISPVDYGPTLPLDQALRKKLVLPPVADPLRAAINRAAETLGLELDVTMEAESASVLASIVQQGMAETVTTWNAARPQLASGELYASIIHSPQLEVVTYLTWGPTLSSADAEELAVLLRTLHSELVPIVPQSEHL